MYVLDFNLNFQLKKNAQTIAITCPNYPKTPHKTSYKKVHILENIEYK